MGNFLKVSKEKKARKKKGGNAMSRSDQPTAVVVYLALSQLAIAIKAFCRFL